MHKNAILAYVPYGGPQDCTLLTPLYIGQEHCGWVNDLWKSRLVNEYADYFEEHNGTLYCHVAGSYEAISRTLGQLAAIWHKEGWIASWRYESFVAFHQDGTPFFELERAVFRVLGLTSRAVHINGLSYLPSGQVGMWVGRRSPHKAVDADRMDNMVGGGVVVGEDIQDALMREGWEEAGLTPAQLAKVRAIGSLHSQRQIPRGWHSEWLYTFDLWLDEGEFPSNRDGEVAEYQLLSLVEVERLLVDRRFIADAGLVCVDCLMRLNYWKDKQSYELALSRIRGQYEYETVV